MRSWMEFTNGEYIIFNHSVPHEKLLPRKEHTRGVSYVTGYYIVPRPGGGCILNFISHSNPKGAIPHALVNIFHEKSRSRYHQEAGSVRREVRGMVRQDVPHRATSRSGALLPWIGVALRQRLHPRRHLLLYRTRSPRHSRWNAARLPLPLPSQHNRMPLCGTRRLLLGGRLMYAIYTAPLFPLLF